MAKPQCHNISLKNSRIKDPPVDRYATFTHRDVLAFEGLQDKVADYPPISRSHPGSEGVEDPSDSYVDSILPEVSEREGLCHTFAFVVARSGPDGIDVAPVGLRLRMYRWTSIDLRSRAEEEACLCSLSETQHVECPEEVGLHRLDLVVLVCPRRGGASEMVDHVALDVEGKGHVVPHKFKVRMPDPVRHGSLASREEVVEHSDFVAQEHETVYEMTAHESSPTGDQDALPLTWAECFDGWESVAGSEGEPPLGCRMDVAVDVGGVGRGRGGRNDW